MWDFTAWQKHPRIFLPLRDRLSYFAKFSDWPSIDDYHQFLAFYAIQNAQTKPLAPVACCQDENYEISIFERGEIEMRAQSWHDFFNLMVWSVFPKIKAAMNALQVREMKQGHFKRRTPLQNRLAHFDESGIIVVSCDDSINQLIMHHGWRELFVEKRDQLQNVCQFFLIGHGKYEQALEPFVGMTAKAIFLKAEHDFFNLSINEKLEHIDQQLCGDTLEYKLQHKLAPLPILGIPGWYVENENPAFYQNKHYFREKRRE